MFYILSRRIHSKLSQFSIEMAFIKSVINGSIFRNDDVKWENIFETRKELEESNTFFVQQTVCLAILLLTFRAVFTRYMLGPFGLYLGVPAPKRIKPTENQLLECAYKSQPEINDIQVREFSKRLDWSDRQVQRWWRMRKRYNQTTILCKFNEQCYFFLTYSVLFSMAVVLLWGIPWFSNTNASFMNFPRAPPPIYRFYFMAWTGLNLSNLLYHFWSVKRSDYWLMLFHHLLAVLLGYFGWISYVHVCCIVVASTHDFADVFLSLTKTLKYARYERLLTVSYVLFIISWISSRTIFYPWFFLGPMRKGILAVQPFKPNVILTVYGVLTIIYVLNLYWTYLILKLTYTFIRGRQITEDIRSFSEGSSADSDVKKMK